MQETNLPSGYTVECLACEYMLGSVYDGEIDMDVPCPMCGERAAVIIPESWYEPAGLDEQGRPMETRRAALGRVKRLPGDAMADMGRAASADQSEWKAPAWRPPAPGRDEYEPGL